jgi:carbon monoxide dehydrogenase subunit G
MEVTIDKQYPIAASEHACWLVLSNITELATCMPGATITEQVDATHYKGSVKVKVGPASAAFAGDIEVLGVDEASKQIQLLGKGADKGGSSASMNLTATITKVDEHNVTLTGKASVIVNGKFAQFGGRMMTSVSDMILQQFANNFDIKAKAMSASLSPVGQGAEGETATSEADANPQSESTNHQSTAASAEAPKLQSELNGLAIAWMLIKNFFAKLVGK